jgi:hypothetical protein
VVESMRGDDVLERLCVDVDMESLLSFSFLPTSPTDQTDPPSER